ncbi:MAG TPA: monovalent cation/H+ antiporter complex subunit F [Halanaerobiales bacterium]|nr:monovalent cation/H+ antiporter complex subunit F [Halanaerobiales bacterium]
MIIGLAIFFTIASLLILIRAVLGPTITDRLIAADSIGIFLTLVILLIGVYYEISLFIDISLGYAILLFIDMLIFSKYFEHEELYK